MRMEHGGDTVRPPLSHPLNVEGEKMRIGRLAFSRLAVAISGVCPSSE